MAIVALYSYCAKSSISLHLFHRFVFIRLAGFLWFAAEAFEGVRTNPATGLTKG